MHSNTKPNKIWVDQFSEFYNNTFRDFLKINIIEMYSIYNEGKSVVTERLIRTLKNKIFKHMAAISKKFYFDMLDELRCVFTLRMIIILNTMKIRIKKILNLKVVTMLEFQNIKTFLQQDILQIGQKKFLLLKKLKIQFLGHTESMI